MPLGWWLALTGRVIALSAWVLSLPLAVDAQSSRPAARSASYAARRVEPPAQALGTETVGGGARVELEVTGDGAFPARASDPVLHVGSVVARSYRYADSTGSRLVFTLPAGAVLEDGAAVYLQYEPGGTPRIDMPPLRLQAIQAEGVH